MQLGIALSAGKHRTVSARVRRAVRFSSIWLVVLSLFIVAGTALTMTGLSRLVDGRLGPLSDVEEASNAYQQAIVVAIKVSNGNLSGQSGITALHGLRQQIDQRWDSLARATSDNDAKLAVLTQEKPKADIALKELERMFAEPTTESLRFYLSGPLSARIDPFLTASYGYVQDLRNRAEKERALLNSLAALTLGTVALFALFGLWMGRRLYRATQMTIIGPLADLAGYIDARSQGEVPCCDRVDEIGDIARALQASAERSRKMEVLAIEKQEMTARLAEADRAAALSNRARADFLESRLEQFGAGVAGLVAELVEMSSGMRAISRQMNTASGENETSAVEALSSVHTMAERMHEIERSSTTLSEMVGQVSTISGSTREQAMSVHRQSQVNRAYADKLRSMVDDIFGTLELISQIARQTNMLALNAAIEASRAGEMGRGFHVVAQEVKGLATQTQNAAAWINSQLDIISATCNEVLSSVSLGEEMASDLNQIADRIAAAMDVQSQSSRHVVHALGDARVGAQAVADQMSDVQARTSSLRDTSANLAAMADGMATCSDALQGAFQRFSNELLQPAA